MKDILCYENFRVHMSKLWVLNQKEHELKSGYNVRYPKSTLDQHDIVSYSRYKRRKVKVRKGQHQLGILQLLFWFFLRVPLNFSMSV